MSAREIRRVRHELQFRTLSVVSVETLTPTLKRIVLGGDGLTGFVSLGFDDHVKIFPVRDGTAPTLPKLGPDGPIFPEPRPVARDYTPRAYDVATNRLTLDFVTGHGGPATQWAEAAKPGSILGVGGPRGSFVVPTDYADHVLIGDETALPAGVRAHVVIETADVASCLPLKSAAEVVVAWATRDGAPRGRPETLLDAVEMALAGIDPSDAYVWIAAEADVAKALRASVLSLGFSAEATKASGYWRLGGEGGEKINLD